MLDDVMAELTADADTYSPVCVQETIHASATAAVDDRNANSGSYLWTYSSTAYFTVWTTTEIHPAQTASKSNQCFAGTELVQLSNGEKVPIASVRVGDRVLAADRSGQRLQFSEVLAVPHAPNNDVKTVFTRIGTRSGADIKMTADHLIAVAPHCSSNSNNKDSLQLMAAKDVAVGMCLFSVSTRDSQESIVHVEEVVSVSTVPGIGVYTLVTKDADLEMIVVNGFIASPFAVNHVIANAYYNVVRALHTMMLPMPMLTGFMDWSLVREANLVLGSLAVSLYR
jgi:hypothetical protein